MKKIFQLSLLTIFISNIGRAQSFAINTDGSVANASALLDVKSTVKGLLIPRMDKTAKNAIASPATGLVVYQTLPDSLGFHYYDGTKWVWFSDANNKDTSAWKITGNSNGTSARFFGTLNDSALHFRIRNVPSGILDSITGNTAFGYGNERNTTTGLFNTSLGYKAMDSTSSGSANVALGSNSLGKNQTGFNNTAIGNAAMYEARGTAGYPFNNTAVGNDALRFNRSYDNTAIGAGALHSDTTGQYNSVVGFNAMYSNLRGYYNTVVGAQAFFSDTTGSNNTVMGLNAMYYHRNGDENVAIGSFTLINDITGAVNTAVGGNAMYNHTSGDNNVAMGYEALMNDVNGGANTAIGTYAMLNHRTQGFNTAVGYQSMYYDSSGAVNTAFGYRSLRYGKRSYESTALGIGTLEFTDSSYYNTAVGRGASIVKGGIYNTAVGYYASGFGALAPTSNYYVNKTTTIGAWAGWKNIADENTFVGYQSGDGAGTDSLRGIENVGVGAYTIFVNTTGKSNSALGLASLNANSTGNGSVGVGTRTLLFNTTGNQNTALGDSALYSNVTGSTNTGIGYLALTSVTNLTNATAIGANAYVGQSNSMVLGSINGTNGASADTKVGIGITTPDSTFSVANKLLIGSSGTMQFDNSVPAMMYMFKSGNSNADRMIVAHSTASPNYGIQYQDASDRLNFLSAGNSVMTIDLFAQKVGIGIPAPTIYQLELSSTLAGKPISSTWFVTSDARLKTIDGSSSRGLNDVLKLKTIRYHYSKGNIRNLPTDETGYGFTAQEVQKIYPEAVKQDKDGYLSLDMHPILVSFVNAFKDQQKQIEDLKKQNELFIKRLEKLEHK